MNEQEAFYVAPLAILGVMAAIVWAICTYDAVGRWLGRAAMLVWGALAIVGPLVVIFAVDLPRGDVGQAVMVGLLGIPLLALPWLYVMGALLRWPQPAWLGRLAFRVRR